MILYALARVRVGDARSKRAHDPWLLSIVAEAGSGGCFRPRPCTLESTAHWPRWRTMGVGHLPTCELQTVRRWMWPIRHSDLGLATQPAAT